MILRPYQATAVAHTIAAIRAGHHPVIALPTGSGKSLVAAALTQAVPGRVLVATHRQELLEQNAATLLDLNPDESVGVYSAGLGRRDIPHRVIFGGVQSIYKRMDALQAWGLFATVIIDECHLVSPRTVPNIMYASVFGALNGATRVGMSATPYRLDSGLLYGGDDTWFDTLACEVGIRQLTPEYLAPLHGVLTAADVPIEGVHITAGEFVGSELSQRACEQVVVEGALTELCRLAAHRTKWLVFCVDVTHTHLVCDALRARGVDVGAITGQTPREERKAILDDFRRQNGLQALCNCQVLTTGFDAPSVDCVALLRPTMSKSLLVQMVGRGSRQAPGKQDCLAEGSLVLTDHGLFPIEKVPYYAKLWDGIQWVTHDGPVYHGEREVITYAGLTATAEHRVWTQEGWRTFRDCASQQIPIAQTGYGGIPLQQDDGYFSRGEVEKQRQQEKSVSSLPMPGMRDAGMEGMELSPTWRCRMQEMCLATSSTEMALSTPQCSQGAMHESERCTVQGLWSEGNSVQLPNSHCCRYMGPNVSWAPATCNARPYRQQWTLRAWESPLVESETATGAYEKASPISGAPYLSLALPSHQIRRFDIKTFPFLWNDLRRHCQPLGNPVQQTKRRVWDILNAGPLHRFTVSGLLVHNCLILDMAGNLDRHAPLDALVSQESSLARQDAEKAKAHAAQRERYAKHATSASLTDPFGEGKQVRTYPVAGVFYRVVPSKKATYAGRNMLLVSYRCPDRPGNQWVSQWVCCEYVGWAREQAVAWFARRGHALIPNAERAAQLRRHLRTPEAITVGEGGQYPTILVEHFPSESTPWWEHAEE